MSRTGETNVHLVPFFAAKKEIRAKKGVAEEVKVG
jgi:hypothetical protein